MQTLFRETLDWKGFRKQFAVQLRQRIHLNRVSEGLVTMGDSILEAIQNELCGKWTLQQSNNFDAALQEMGNYFVFCILYYI